MKCQLSCLLPITIKFHMQDLIVSDRNADMASLVILVTVQTADMTECSVRKDIDFVD